MQANTRILLITYTDFFKPITNLLGDNSGNTVYYTSGVSMLYSKTLSTVFQTTDKILKNLNNDINWARRNFDICIMMEANIFSEFYNNTMLSNANLIKKLGIPTFVLGAGCQSTLDYSLNFLHNIKENSKRYIHAIKHSGGDITLRGEFTRHALEQIGCSDLFVSGCPSLFLLDRNFQMDIPKISKENFKPMLNAHLVSDINEKIYKEFPDSIYFDQDIYFKALYFPSKVKDAHSLIYKNPFKKLYEENRIQGDMNYYMWRKQIKEGRFNFSYGSRIHGNIIAIQNNIPAFVKIVDSRTRELAEFFDIANSIITMFDEKTDSLYDLYSNLDYNRFNQNFSKKYDAFKTFLDKNKIPNCLDNNQEYLEFLSTLNFWDYRKDANIRAAKKMLIKELEKKKLIYKEKFGNKRVLHFFGIKISYKK